MMWALLLLAPAPIHLVDRLELSPSYAVSAVFYGEGERVASDVMTLDIDDWVILKLAYVGHAGATADAAQIASVLISEVCEAQCPPCAELTPAARVRIDELLDTKERLSQEKAQSDARMRAWRAVAIGVSLGLLATIGIVAAF